MVARRIGASGLSDSGTQSNRSRADSFDHLDGGETQHSALKESIEASALPNRNDPQRHDGERQGELCGETAENGELCCIGLTGSGTSAAPVSGCSTAIAGASPSPMSAGMSGESTNSGFASRMSSFAFCPSRSSFRFEPR